MNQIENFSSPIVNFEIRNGILIAKYKAEILITLELAKNNVKDRIEFTKGKPYPILIKDYGVTQMEKEARTYLSSDEATNGINAAAFIIKSIFSLFLINFFVKISRPKIPIELFKTEDEALKWLEQYKSNS